MSMDYLQINEHPSNYETLILPDAMPLRHKNNGISTMQYNWLTFLPYNLIKQLTQPSNVYFIVIGILQIIPSTSYTNGVPVVYVPLAIVMAISILKDALEEYQRYKSDQQENNRKTIHYAGRKYVECTWKQLHQGDIVLVKEGEYIPCDLLVLSTSVKEGVGFVETKQIDGETNLKQKYSLSEMQSRFHIDNVDKIRQHNVKFIFDQFNPVLYKLSGSYQISGQDVSPIGYGNFIERGCSLQNTEWIVGLAIHAGLECKIMLNSTKPNQKRSRLESVMRTCIMAISFTLFGCCILASFVEYFWTKSNISYEYLGLNKENVFIDAGLWFSLLSYFIPISLMVNVELVKFGQGKMMQSDLVMPNAVANQSNLIEQLGEIDFVFSDKTGTLTQNKMIFKELYTHNQQEALMCMSVCHSVIKADGKLIAQSPDELSILEYCSSIGVHFNGIDNEGNMTINQQQIKRVMLFEFTSEKKRMTVVVSNDNGYVVYCKGADEVVLELIDENTVQIKQQLRQFATQGYRTLVLAKRGLANKYVEQLLEQYNKGKETNDEQLLDKIQQEIEHRMSFVGVSAVEDLLADDVGVTIQSLRQAGMRTWVLTGDKVETSISIGYACNLIGEHDQVQVINECTVACIEEVFLHYCNEPSNIALVISGQALTVMLDNPQLKQVFLKKALSAKAVIVARVSPKQKQQVVHLIKQVVPNAVTLAIGDGANDVSMITEAHVGIGIRGVEGTSAARSADFAISEFKHLRRLLFYYGVECSRRNALTILYIFYKNQVFISPYFWFGVLNGFSGQYLYDQWLQQLFNTLFASMPQVLYALFDEIFASSEYFQITKTTPNELELRPDIYLKFKQDPIFTITRFWYWVLNGMLQGGIILFVCLYLNENQDMSHGKTICLSETGVLIYACTILLVNCKIFTFTYTNYPFTIIIIIISIVSYWTCLLLVSDKISSDAFDYFRFLHSPQPYLAILLTLNLFLVDLAYERKEQFQQTIKLEQSIELV